MTFKERVLKTFHKFIGAQAEQIRAYLMNEQNWYNHSWK